MRGVGYLFPQSKNAGLERSVILALNGFTA